MENVVKTTENWTDIIAEKDSLIAEQESQIEQLKSKLSELEALTKYYEEQLRLAKHRQFGASSEKTEIPEQLGLFDEAENTADLKKAEPDIETITYTRRKQAGKREDDLSYLPVETVEYSLPEDEGKCPECGGALHVMGHEIRRELKVIPAQVKVIEHRRKIYSCRNCEKTEDHTPIVKAPMPEPVIKGSLASPSAIAHIMTQKFVMYNPLYRQEQDWLRQGLSLSRQTMANWVIRASEDWLEPIYERMRQELLNQEVLHADETTLQVLREPGRAARQESYMWLYRTSGDTEHPIVLYEYQPTRSSAHPKRFLTGYTGYLHTDGYSGYHTLSGITVVGCFAHLRRKFDEAVKALPPEKREGSESQKGLELINELFALEHEFEGLTPEQRKEARLERSKPKAEAFFAWAKSLGALPKSALGKAIRYAEEQYPWLMNVYLDGRLELTNNRAERSIKPFVMGRKNWLFNNTVKGARASSVIYSIIETAKENGLKPFEYLEFLFETMPNTTMGMLDKLLPWSPEIPDRCRMSPHA